VAAVTPIDVARVRETFAAVLARVQEGKAYVIRRFGRPIAEIVPVGTWAKANPEKKEGEP
jgi:antitoxin (DNA-binding transcriptional repressor) of toxin-antitoxin stability system